MTQAIRQLMARAPGKEGRIPRFVREWGGGQEASKGIREEGETSLSHFVQSGYSRTIPSASLQKELGDN